MEKLELYPLTVNAFAPYGWAVMQPDAAPDIQNDLVDYWHDMADISGLGTLGLIGFMRVKKIEPSLKTLQKLYESPEAYITLNGKPSVIFVSLSLPDGSPDFSTLKAFQLIGGQSVVVAKNVWHCTPFALAEPVDFALMLHNNVIVKKDGAYGVDLCTIEYTALQQTLTF